ncbi:MAG: hypothetical protein K0R17_516 [Rariglobus sp.]|jgi:hypothetical protein|nr:hypothetical protein [Rariglobus sp.]
MKTITALLFASAAFSLNANEESGDTFDYSGPIACEPFDYAPAATIKSAPDSASDFGWTGATWSSSNDVIAPGLSTEAIRGLGNALRFTSNRVAARSINPSAMPPDYRVLDGDDVYRLGKAGTTLWVGVLLRADGADATGALIGAVNLAGASAGGGIKLTIGDTGPAPQWAVAKGTMVAASDTAITQNQTTLLVVRIQFTSGANNDEVDLFVNPEPGPNPPATPSALLRNIDVGTFDRVEFKGSRLMSGDEFMVATSWAGAIGR